MSWDPLDRELWIQRQEERQRQVDQEMRERRMVPLSRNFGRLGGYLDASKHVEVAVKRMCTPDEIGVYCDRTQAMPPGRRIDNGSTDDGSDAADD